MFEDSQVRDARIREARLSWIASIDNRCDSLVKNIALFKTKDPLKASHFEGLLRESREWISAIV
jgi:hypothetical protein